MSHVVAPSTPPGPAEAGAVSSRGPVRPAKRTSGKSRRGFAAMDPETQRRIASQGGKASHASGRGHRFSPAEASEAGRKGGRVSRRGKKPA